MNLYEKYYLSDECKKDMLKKAIIVFDTSALLDLYYYSSKSQDEIFNNVFDVLKERLWIPSQVYFEFLKNKTTVSEKPIQSYRRLYEPHKNNSDSGYVYKISNQSKEIGSLLISIKNQLKTLKEQTIPTEKHPNLPAECYTNFEEQFYIFESRYNDFLAATSGFQDRINLEIEKQISVIRDEMSTDSVEDAINKNFTIGSEYVFSKMFEISKVGAYRYSEKIPPGYMDVKEKEGMQKYGDLYVWYQILEYASQKHNDVLFITNDKKEDWYDSGLEAPRFELLKEFNEQSKCNFWSYDMKTFLFNINTVLDEEKKITKDVLEEVISIQEDRTHDKFSEEQFYDLVKDFLPGNIDLLGTIDINGSWRVFGSIRLFEGIDNDTGNPVFVMLNFVRGSNYTSLLHAVRNIFNVKKYYDEENSTYDYYQLTIAKSQEMANDLARHLERKNIKKLYDDHTVKSYIGYILDDAIRIVNSNINNN